ncbi:MAG: GNAT family N-acetyltransferase [Phycisphaerae bacterium]|nr:GNAT family N-acetyltransferase [Phycisphaerae bacterium]
MSENQDKDASTSNPRPARLDEFDELMRFLAATFGKEPSDFFQTHYPLLYRREESALQNNLIVKDGEEIISHLGLFPLKCILGKGSVTVGGIGGVATAPAWRGKGLMGRLLELCLSIMSEKGYPLSVLSGYRPRYANFGWEYAFRNIIFSVTRKSLRWNKVEKTEIHKYEGGGADLELIIAAYQAQPLRAVRSQSDFSCLLEGREDIETWISGSSYVITSNWAPAEIIECGGRGTEVLAILLSLMEKADLDKVTIKRPDIYGEINNSLTDASESWSETNLFSARIMDLKGVLEAFGEQMAEKYKSLGNETPGSVSLEMTDTDQRATIHFGKNLKISSEEAPNIVSLPRLAMTRLLFGFLPPRNVLGLSPTARQLETIFPLDFYLPRLNNI